MSADRKKLWAFNWRDGGYNQVYAHTYEKALDQADLEFGAPRFCRHTVVDLHEVNEKKYWANFPVFD